MTFPLGSFPLGEIVTGQIVRLEPRGVLVNFGSEQPAYISQSDLSLANIQSSEEAVQLDEIREFLVVGNYDWEDNHFFLDSTPETLNNSDQLYEYVQYMISREREQPINREDLIVHTKILSVKGNGVLVKIQCFLCSLHPPIINFSIRRLEIQTAWKRIRQLHAEDVTLFAKITQKRTHSAIVNIEGIQGFIDIIDRRKKELVIGEEIQVKILEAKEEINRLRLIQSSVLIKLRQLQVDQIIHGVVRAVKPYGVFIEFDGLYALLHISKIVPSVENLVDTFRVGEFVKARIAEIYVEWARVYLKSCENRYNNAMYTDR